MEDKKKVKAYISGPISGLSEIDAKDRFNGAKQVLISKGYEPFSPLDNGLPWDASHSEHMMADVQKILDIAKDGGIMVMLPYWFNSRGASLERDIALQIGMVVYYDIRDVEHKQEIN